MTRVTSQTLNKSDGKKCRKRCIFRWLRKTGRDDADVTWRGRSFQVRAVATGKAQSPTVNSRVRRTGSDMVSADRRRVPIPGSAGRRSSSAKYVICLLLSNQIIFISGNTARRTDTQSDRHVRREISTAI